MSLDFLDYFWRTLLLTGAISTLVYAWMWVFAKLAANHLSRSQVKWALNAHYALLALLVAGQALTVFGIDRELASRCFAVFAASETSFTLTRLLGGLWLGGVAMGIAVEFSRNRVALRRVRELNSPSSGVAVAVAEEVRSVLGLRRKIEILANDESVGPYAAGFFRHSIVMSNEFIDVADRHTLKAVIAHEMVHVRDRDSLWLSLETFLRRLFFFQPLAYVLSREYTSAVEGAADEGAVKLGGIEPRVLLKTLMDLVAGFAPRSTVAAEVPASRGFHEMHARIRALSHRSLAKDISRAAFLLFVGVSLSLTAALALTQGPAAEAIETTGREGGFMCRQIKHEKMIEAWLHIEREPVMCK